MKSADRALEFVVVGLGQGGGNLATEFARLGYRALALNTAHTDLSSLSSENKRGHSLDAEHRIYVGIDGYDGAGADLNYGRECIRENATRIREAVTTLAQDADVVILTAGLGGGTGSSISELVEVLSDLGLPMLTMATLPNEYESGIAKVNAVRAVSDLVKAQDVGWIFADNTRLSQTHGGVSLDRYFEKVNEVIIGPLDQLNRLNNRPGVQPIRTIDGEDFRALLLSNGVINYATNTLSALSVDAVMERIRENLAQSSTMPSGFSLEEVSYMGVVLEAPESILKDTPFSFFEQLNERLKDETGGGGIYMGVYRTEHQIEGGVAELRMICSTQSLPEGIQAVVNDARREGGTLRDKLQRTISTLDLGEIEDFDLFQTSSRTSSSGNSRRRPSRPVLDVGDGAGTGAIRTARRRGKTTSAGSSESSSKSAPDPEPDPGGADVPPKPSLLPPNEVAAALDQLETEPPPASSPDKSSKTKAASPADDGAAISIDEELDELIVEEDDDVMELTADQLEDAREDAIEEDSDTTSVSKADDAEPADDDPVQFEKLVTTFLRTNFESTKRRVARRIQSARDSKNTGQRRLADEAVERIRTEGRFDDFELALRE